MADKTIKSKSNIVPTKMHMKPNLASVFVLIEFHKLFDIHYITLILQIHKKK